MSDFLVTAFAFGLLCGSCVAIWRTWAFARKLIHLGVSLDAWSEYDEPTRQAHGQSRPPAIVRDISERRSDR